MNTAAFSSGAHLLEAKVDSFGQRSSLDQSARRRLFDERLASLGDISFQRVEVAPLEIEHFGIKFGLQRLPKHGIERGVHYEITAGHLTGCFFCSVRHAIRRLSINESRGGLPQNIAC
ncbi:hypothetical protein DWU98_09630 [Dyella monticola]|uniref:Uncharacterized protein n=1 Tax=Dyella monticola TaxID=1927958 RepID=A0A370X1X8_9GAMM|nr:hypothetical protein DWU98_09630 [Dyella monticola]